MKVEMSVDTVDQGVSLLPAHQQEYEYKILQKGNNNSQTGFEFKLYILLSWVKGSMKYTASHPLHRVKPDATSITHLHQLNE